MAVHHRDSDNTHGLHVIVPIDEHRLLLWVLTELAEDSRGQIQALTLQRLPSEILEHRRHPECFELLLEPVTHRDRLTAVGRIAADTARGRDRVRSRSDRECVRDACYLLIWTASERR